MRNKGLKPRLLYPARGSVKMENQIRSFLDKRSLKEYTSSKPALQEMIKGFLRTGRKTVKERGTQAQKNGNE